MLESRKMDSIRISERMAPISLEFMGLKAVQKNVTLAWKVL
jgi:hypothetical protein